MASQKHISLAKHTSLLRILYITNLSCFYSAKSQDFGLKQTMLNDSFREVLLKGNTQYG